MNTDYMKRLDAAMALRRAAARVHGSWRAEPYSSVSVNHTYYYHSACCSMLGDELTSCMPTVRMLAKRALRRLAPQPNTACNVYWWSQPDGTDYETQFDAWDARVFALLIAAEVVMDMEERS